MRPAPYLRPMHVPLLLADNWPDTLDIVVLVGYVAVVLGVPTAGYVLLAVDIRSHYRRFRQALVVVSNHTRQIPQWVMEEARRRRKPPQCLATFGLKLPCTEADLLQAYRDLVKTRHPDLGGDRDAFLQLQKHFEEARSLLSAQD